MKIALVAMSGIRACDEELLRLGLTLPGFVERSKTIASLPSLGLLTLAALTPAEHEVSYIEVPDITQFEDDLQEFDLVGISSYSAQINEAYELAARCRGNGTAVVMGGPHVTMLPEEAQAHCDAVVVGEGEACWGQVLADRAAGGLKPVYGGTKADYRLDEAPVPAFELLDIEQYNRLTVQTSRGCPHRCEFCASSTLLTDQYKQKPVAKVVAEIDKILEIWPEPFIEFADDNSCVNRQYWKELMTALEGRRFRWFAETDISVSQDDELLEMMRRQGCAQVLIGLESPSEAALAGVELRSDWKRQRFGSYRNAIENIQAHGITVNGCFVIGLDGHTPAVFDEVFTFVQESGLYEVQVTVMTPFPGTPLHERLEKEGRLLEPGHWQKCTLFDIMYQPSHMSVEELAVGFRKLVVKLYGEEFTHRRRDNFKQQLRRHQSN